MSRRDRQLRSAEWHDYLGEFQYSILPTASADPELNRVYGSPQFASYQWHRTSWFDDPDLDPYLP